MPPPAAAAEIAKPAPASVEANKPNAEAPKFEIIKKPPAPEANTVAATIDRDMKGTKQEGAMRDVMSKLEEKGGEAKANPQDTYRQARRQARKDAVKQYATSNPDNKTNPQEWEVNRQNFLSQQMESWDKSNPD